MTNEEVIKYLMDGQKRGYAFEMLKRNLLNGGFSENEINEALIAANQRKELERGLMTNKDISPELGQGLMTNKNTSPLKDSHERYYGVKWMKVAGIMGIIFLIMIVIFYLGIYIPKILEMWASINATKTANIIIMVVLLCMNFLFFFGFFRLGKFSESGIVKASSLGIIIFLFLGVVGSILVGMFLSEESKNMVPSLAPESDFTSSFNGSGGASFASNINSEIKLVYVLILAYLLLNVIFFGLLGIGLIKLKDDLKLPAASGIIFLISTGFGLSIFVYGIYLAILIYSNSPNISELFRVTLVMGISLYVFIFNTLYLLLFGSLTMFEASKKYED